MGDLYQLYKKIHDASFFPLSYIKRDYYYYKGKDLSEITKKSSLKDFKVLEIHN